MYLYQSNVFCYRPILGIYLCMLISAFFFFTIVITEHSNNLNNDLITHFNRIFRRIQIDL